ncbi:MAG: hypothetical protein COB97_05710 [Paracoccus sp.]|nr:MAG: hypothetical protein COB97_05710 [Paracoccus sp. (in: a-proteobacteria)]
MKNPNGCSCDRIGKGSKPSRLLRANVHQVLPQCLDEHQSAYAPSYRPQAGAVPRERRARRIDKAGERIRFRVRPPDFQQRRQIRQKWVEEGRVGRQEAADEARGRGPATALGNDERQPLGGKRSEERNHPVAIELGRRA